MLLHENYDESIRTGGDRSTLLLMSSLCRAVSPNVPLVLQIDPLNSSVPLFLCCC